MGLGVSRSLFIACSPPRKTVTPFALARLDIAHETKNQPVGGVEVKVTTNDNVLYHSQSLLLINEVFQIGSDRLTEDRDDSAGSHHNDQPAFCSGHVEIGADLGSIVLDNFC